MNPGTEKFLKFLKGFGFFVLYLFLTLLASGVIVYLLGTVWKQNNNVTGGVWYSVIGYFWGIFFLQKQSWVKIAGIVLFALTVGSNLLLISSPYDSQAEFISTRIFIVTALGAGIYLIFRRSVASKIFGILLLLTSIFAALLGAFFMMGNL